MNLKRFGWLGGPIVVCLLIFSVPAAASPTRLTSPQLKESLRAALVDEGLRRASVRQCRMVKSANAFLCRWLAYGNYADGSSFACRGQASFAISRSTWKIDQCRQPMLRKLLLERGLQPARIVQKPERGVHQVFSWLAAGFDSGQAVPYRCRGHATYALRTRRWQIEPCRNQLGPFEPLSPTPGAHPVLGFNDDWNVREIREQLPRATDIGTTVARYTISWFEVELVQDRYNWILNDEKYGEILAAGVRPLFVIANAPCWAQANPPPDLIAEPGKDCPLTGAPSKAAVGEFAQFAALVAQRYPLAAGIEVWNEPNWTPYWSPRPDPALYSKLIRRTAASVHDQGSQMPVIVAGNAPLGQNSSNNLNWGYREYLRAVLDAGGIGEADAVGHHVYFGETGDLLLDFRRQIGRVRSTLRRHGLAGIPIWITELGVSSNPPLGLDGQAFVLGLLYEAVRRMASVPMLVVHRFVDQANSQTGETIDPRGVLDAGGNPKPAYCLLGTARGLTPAGC